MDHSNRLQWAARCRAAPRARMHKGVMKAHRLSDQEFLSLLAAPGPGWDLDAEGRFLVLPVAERDLAWTLDCCREHTEGDYYVLPGGDGVVFARERDLAFARYLIL